MCASLAETEDPPISATGRPPRADALRNRQRLLDAARRAFATAGDKVPLDAIAREAGVGIGTLYRHFPTREALVEAIYRAELGRLCDSADELLATHDPDVALRRWMDGFADYITTKQELADALRAVMASGAVTTSQARDELAAAAQRILDAGAAAGTLRTDVRADDVVTNLVGIFLVSGQPDEDDQAGRLLDLMMDGLRVAR